MAAGNGKTTTLACIVDAVNQTRNGHIITLEDPIHAETAVIHAANAAQMARRLGV